jgi:hypothetical protein
MSKQLELILVSEFNGKNSDIKFARRFEFSLSLFPDCSAPASAAK